MGESAWVWGGSDLAPVSPSAGRPLAPVGLFVSQSVLPSQERMARRFPSPLGFHGARELSHPATVSWAGLAVFGPEWPLLPGTPPVPRGRPVPGRRARSPRLCSIRPAVARLSPAGKQPASPGQRAGGGHVLPVGGAPRPPQGRASGGPPGSSPGWGWGAPWAVTWGQAPTRSVSSVWGRGCWTDSPAPSRLSG